MPNTIKNTKPEIGSDDWIWLGIVIEKVKSLQFGTVEITVHERSVTRIETTDRLHLDKKPAAKSGEKAESAVHSE
jgi:hypothetical protein